MHETKCIRCDREITYEGPVDEHLMLSYNQETGFVVACADCKDVVKERNIR